MPTHIKTICGGLTVLALAAAIIILTTLGAATPRPTADPATLPAIDPKTLTIMAANIRLPMAEDTVGSSRVDLQACKLEYSIVSPK